MPIPALVAARPEDVGVDPALLAKVYARAQQEVDSGAVDACQVAVCRHGKLAGMATRGRMPGGEAATDATLFSIFSCTKLVVAIGMWQLLEEGLIALTDRVVRTPPLGHQIDRAPPRAPHAALAAASRGARGGRRRSSPSSGRAASPRSPSSTSSPSPVRPPAPALPTPSHPTTPLNPGVLC